ncbi:MAG: SRPBCC family protein [Gemmatimonadales bacterium]
MTRPSPPQSSPRALAPVPSLLMAFAGGLLIGRRDDLSPRARAAATIGGLALIGVAAREAVMMSVRLAGSHRRAADVHMSIVVPHPVEVVFRFVRDFENFPCIIGALRHVSDHGDGRSHWSASTPRGGILEWDTETTKYVPNSVIGWRSVVGSPVRMEGLIRLLPEGSSTCLKLAIDYEVVDGGFVDSLVALTTTSRQQEIERDIARLSTYLDTVRSSPVQAPLKA